MLRGAAEACEIALVCVDACGSVRLLRNFFTATHHLTRQPDKSIRCRGAPAGERETTGTADERTKCNLAVLRTRVCTRVETAQGDDAGLRGWRCDRDVNDLSAGRTHAIP